MTNLLSWLFPGSQPDPRPGRSAPRPGDWVRPRAADPAPDAVNLWTRDVHAQLAEPEAQA